MAGSRRRTETTRLLLEIGAAGAAAGPDPRTADLLFGTLYDSLRKLARDLLRKERGDHTLRPTALVHEAYLRLVDQDQMTVQSRAHFFGIAARAMRQILVDHARERNARKRGGGSTRITFTEELLAHHEPQMEVLDLHGALERLEQVDERAARIVEMRVFGGLSVEEAAEALGVSTRTVGGDWQFARMWLSREITGGAG